MSVHPLFGPVPALRYHVYASWQGKPVLWGNPHAELAAAAAAADFTVTEQGAERAVVLADSGQLRYEKLAPLGRVQRPQPQPARSRPSLLAERSPAERPQQGAAR